MKPIVTLLSTIILSAVFLAACNRPSGELKNLQATVDSMQQQLKGVYKPGMGELMSGIQLHHAKLWFAGENKNWLLAEYNESLIHSAFKKIQLYHGDQPEAKAAFMILPAMDSISNAIREKDKHKFERSFHLMTITCNNCHAVTNHPFNVITIPIVPPVTDQRF
ncbi:MAG TPA: hypothetical protein VL727_06445 [Puia sp.]|nr:hypothetical protein [Puia sp.]